MLRASGAVEPVIARGAPLLGLLDEARYPENAVLLQPGDGLLLFTDGVTECFNPGGDAYGEARLMNQLVAAGPLGPGQLLDYLPADLDQFAEGLPAYDDVTALALRFSGRRRR